MKTIKKHQTKQDALHKAKFQVSILKNVLWSTENENMRNIINGSIEVLEELIAVTENEHK